MKRAVTFLTCFLIFITNSCLCLRDPFSLAPGVHVYACAAIGTIHGGSRFALIAIDARCFTVKEGEGIANHTVIAIAEDTVTVKDSRGNEHFIVLKKRTLQLK